MKNDCLKRRNVIALFIIVIMCFSTMFSSPMTVYADGELELTVSAEPVGGGNVTGQRWNNIGDSVTINAVPNDGYKFVGWKDSTGDMVSSQPSYTFTMTKSTSYIALFTRFEGGEGTVNNPYEINTAEQLVLINEHLDKHFKLISNINLSSYGVEVSIGSVATPFTGSFDGNGKTISNLTIHRPDESNSPLPQSYGVGLFAIGAGGTVKDLTIEGASIRATGIAGILAGYNYGEVVNCNVQGSVNVTHNQQGAGGLVGENIGVIRESSACGSVNGKSNIGGLVGNNSYASNLPGQIIDSYANVVVTGGNYIGGLVGFNESGSYNGTDQSAIISGSFAKGNVSGEYQIGGLVGANNGEISNCYATGNVTELYDYGDIGGLVGNNGGSITSSYGIGFVSNGGINSGGLSGSNSGAIQSSFYDQNTSGQTDTGKGIPKVTSELIALSTYSGWDFTDTWQKGSNTYPYFKWQTSNIPIAGEILEAPVLSLKSTGDQSVVLEWTNIAEATEYIVYQGTESGNYTQIGTTSGLTYGAINLTNNTSYYFAVRSKNTSKESGYSNEVSGTSEKMYQLNFLVKNTSEEAISDVKVTVSGQEILTDSSGNAVFNLPNGTYSYTTSKTGYVGSFGFGIIINNKDVSISIILNASATIEYVEFEDPDLLWVLKKLGADKDEDGKIVVEEALMVTSIETEHVGEALLEVSGDVSIDSLVGLEAFENLEVLKIDTYICPIPAAYDVMANITDMSPIAGLTKLRELSLGGNIQSIPDISSMTELRSLTLWGRGGNNTIIDDLTPVYTLTNLERLKIMNFHVEDISGITALNKLTYLDLSGNKIKDIEAIYDIRSKLTKLSLTGNPIINENTLGAYHVEEKDFTVDGTDYEVWKQGPVNMTEVMFGDPDLLWVLKKLGADKDEDGKIVVEEALMVTSIETEHVGAALLEVSSDVSIDSLVGLEAFENLEVLKIDTYICPIPAAYDVMANITDMSPVAGLTKLRELSLGGNIQTIPNLSSMTELRSLTLWGRGGNNTIIDDLTPVYTLTNLERLKIMNFHVEDISGITTLNNLIYLDLSGNKIKDIEAIYDISSKLTKLSLTGNPIVNENTLGAYHVEEKDFTVDGTDYEVWKQGPVNMTEVMFGDPDLLWVLKKLGADKDEDGKIVVEEALMVTSIETEHVGAALLEVSSDVSIDSLVGLEAFENLEVLKIDTYICPIPAAYDVMVDITDMSPVAGLTKLRELSLGGNIQSIPDLSSMTELRSLTLWGRGGNNTIIDDLTPVYILTNLERLKIMNFHVEDISGITALNKLTYLDLSGNKIKDIEAIYDIRSKLTKLSLTGNPIVNENTLGAYHVEEKDFTVDGTDYEVWKQGPVNMTEVMFGDPDLLWVLKKLGADKDDDGKIVVSEALMVTSIETEHVGEALLEVSGDVSIDSLVGLEAFENLEVLKIDTYICPIPAAYDVMANITDMSPIAGLTKLRELSLGGNIQSIPDLSSMAALRSLTLWGRGGNNTIIDDLTPVYTLTNLERLKIMNFHVEDISGITALNNLTYLDLSGNKIKDIEAIYDISSKLTKLSLTGNPIINENTLGAYHVEGKDFTVGSTNYQVWKVRFTGNIGGNIGLANDPPINLNPVSETNNGVDDVGSIQINNQHIEQNGGRARVDLSRLDLEKNVQDLLKTQRGNKDLLRKEELNNLNERESRITLTIETDENLNGLEINLPPLEKVFELVDRINIMSDYASFELQKDTFGEHGNDNIKLSAASVDKDDLPRAIAARLPEGVSEIIDLNAFVGENKVSSFQHPIEVTVPYSLKEGEDPEKVSVYLLNDNGEIEKVAGKYDIATGKITFKRNHFSNYFVSVSTDTFNDIQKNWAKKSIEVMAGKGFISGIGNGLFQPERLITKAEFTALIARILMIETDIDFDNFQDIGKNAWFKKEFNVLYEVGIVKGVSSNQFAPNKRITREEAAVILANTLNYLKYVPNNGSEEPNYKDKDTISTWAKEQVKIVSKEEIMRGYPTAVFKPANNLTRAEAAHILYQFYHKYN